MRMTPQTTSKLLAALLCSAALAGCASTSDAAKLAGSDKKSAAYEKSDSEKFLKTAVTDLDGGVRQAQLLRQAGRQDEAIRTLSQLMLVASDDPRIVGEYGKALVEKGRAQDAVDFLRRATELSPNDWSLYSAMGVAYDQLGNQDAARAAYEHALALRPGEPSVLNNYALSRMMADDAETARALMARAHIAGGDNDPKIARNIEMMQKLAPKADAMESGSEFPLAYAVQKPAPSPVPNLPASIARNMTAAPRPVSQNPTPNTAPRPLVQAMPPVAQQMPQQMPQQQVARANPMPLQQRPNNGVVMQAVPFDPLAGPVATHHAATRAPRPLVTGAVHDETAAKVAQAAKPEIKTEAKVAPVVVTVKTADAKPVQAPKVLPPIQAPKVQASKIQPAMAKPAPVKAAAVKPPTVKSAADKKDGVPSLRMTADARSVSGF